MRYFIDCEFNSFGGDILSIAIVPENGTPLYLALPQEDIDLLVATKKVNPWVAEYVLPVMTANGLSPEHIAYAKWGDRLQQLLSGDDDIIFVADWPEDIAHLMNVMMVSPGKMINLPSFKTEMHRVDAHYINLAGAVRHNALWDALSLKNLYLQAADSIHQPLALSA